MIKVESRGERGAVGLVVLARAERANALDAAHWQALADAVRKVAADGARAIVITGEGRTFCAGGDLNEPDYAALLAGCTDATDAITTASVPVIAYVNGPAIGAGLQLVVACDLRVAGPTARFAIPAAAISRPAHPTLIRRIVAHAGIGAARAMLLGGEQLDLSRAREVGLVERLGDLDSSLAWADQIAGYAPLVLQYFKRELLVADEAGDPRYQEFMATLLASEDYAEAALAHAEKRRPRFTGQ